MLDISLRRVQGAFTVDAAFTTAETGITALFGPSGSGKTSVINMVAGLTRPDNGRIVVGGRPVFDSATGVDLPMDKRRIGYVFQEGRLFPHMTVRTNLLYGQRRTPLAEQTVPFDAVIEMLGIGALLDRRPARLSGGEKQRVAVGRALLASPRLLLMDEPLAALDSNRKEEVLPFIARLPREFSIPILYVTHSMDEILRLADVLVLMDGGRSAAVGAVEDLLNRADLRPLTGRHEPGSVVAGVVVAHDPHYFMTRLDTPAGPLVVPMLDSPPGRRVRVRILARDVALAVDRPPRMSVQNVFTGRVEAVTPLDNGAAEIELIVGPGQGCRLMARVTQRAVAELGLARGMAIHALVKAVSIARGNIGEHLTVGDNNAA